MRFPPELLQKVKYLEISTRKLVNNVLTGEYHSAFKGQGMIFSDFREYVHGDDVRSISWGVTAKAGKPYIKRFEEERELSIVLAVDVSGSGDFGSGNFCKGEIIAHLAAMIGFSAVQNGDMVGLLLFSDRVEHYLPPKKGRGNMHRILRDLLYLEPKSKRTSLMTGLEHLYSVLKKQSYVFVFSDFFDENYERSLKKLAGKHDVTAVIVEDEKEREFPRVGVIEMQDAETGELMAVDTSSASFQKNLKENFEKRKKTREKLLRGSNVAAISVMSAQNYVQPLLSFFQKRQKR
jgi:uncharacterized protein (DUF58 family)